VISVEKSQTFQVSETNVFFVSKECQTCPWIFSNVCDFPELFRICASEREAHSSKQIACDPLPSSRGFRLLPVKPKKGSKRKLTYRPPLPTGNGDWFVCIEASACVDYVEEDT
jgi:hypothetical protein